MAGAAAGYQRDLAPAQRPSADEIPFGSQFDDVGVRGREAIKAFVEHGVDRIHQPLHPDFLRLGRRSNAPASVLQQRGEARDVAPVFRDQGVDRLVSPRIPQIGHGQADHPNSRSRLAGFTPARMRLS